MPVRPPFGGRAWTVRSRADLDRGSRVLYVGEARDDLPARAAGAIVSDVPGRMDVTPFATPPTVAEHEDVLVVEVDFDNVGTRRVALDDLVTYEQ